MVKQTLAQKKGCESVLLVDLRRGTTCEIKGKAMKALIDMMVSVSLREDQYKRLRLQDWLSRLDIEISQAGDDHSGNGKAPSGDRRDKQRSQIICNSKSLWRNDPG